LIAYREDSSNAKEDYLRNKIRLKLMPVIDEINNETSSKIAETINRLNDANEIYNDRIQQLIPTFFKPIDNGYAIEIKRLKSLKGSPTLLFEAISKFNFNYDMVLNILNVKESGRYFRSDTHQLLVDRTHYFIHEIKNEIIVDNIEIIENASEINSENFSLIIKKIDPSSKIIIDENIAQFNHDLIAYPLILRQWQAGDYFYPLGLNKKKKVSQLLKNNKINRNDKQKTWVICIDKKIIWVLGMRIDHRFRVDENTKTILNIELINNK
jgi:tRNA(Ile)-lysidine synthase